MEKDTSSSSLPAASQVSGAEPCDSVIVSKSPLCKCFYTREISWDTKKGKSSAMEEDTSSSSLTAASQISGPDPCDFLTSCDSVIVSKSPLCKCFYDFDFERLLPICNGLCCTAAMVSITIGISCKADLDNTWRSLFSGSSAMQADSIIAAFDCCYIGSLVVLGMAFFIGTIGAGVSPERISKRLRTRPKPSDWCLRLCTEPAFICLVQVLLLLFVVMHLLISYIFVVVLFLVHFMGAVCKSGTSATSKLTQLSSLMKSSDPHNAGASGLFDGVQDFCSDAPDVDAAAMRIFVASLCIVASLGALLACVASAKERVHAQLQDKSDTPSVFADISSAKVAVDCPEMPLSRCEGSIESMPQHQDLAEEGEALPLNFDSLETFRDWKASADEDEQKETLEASAAGQGLSPEHLSLITSIQVQSLVDPDHLRQLTADQEHLRPNATSDLVVVAKPDQGKAQLQDRLDCPVSELAEERQLRQKADCELPQLGGRADQQLDKWPSWTTGLAQLEKTVALNLNNSKPPSDASDVSHTTMDGAWLPVEKPGRKAIYQQALPSDQQNDFIKDKVPASPRLEPEVTGTPEASEFHPSFSKQMEIENSYATPTHKSKETDLLDGKTSDAPILRKIVTRRTKPKTAPTIFDTPAPAEVGLGLFAEPPSSTGLSPCAPAPTTKRLVKRRAPSSKPVSRLSESSEDSLHEPSNSL